MNMKTTFYWALILISSIPSFVGCSGKKVDENNPQAVYEDAEDDIKGKKYQVALDKLKTVKNKFPYSHLATVAQLRIADVYFDEESYIESAGAYESFRDLHPKHEKADYVSFRIGESYFNQLPGTNDRDLTPAQKAIDAYRELKTLYPNSQYAAKAAEHSNEATERLAEKEKYIADFYYSRDMFDSAARRYEKITTRFPGTDADQYSYWHWGQSLINQSSQPDFKDKQSELLSEAKHVFRVYLSRYPNGTYTQKAGDWLDKNGGR